MDRGRSGKTAWLALLVGSSQQAAPPPSTGLADLLTLDRAKPVFRTALYHATVMVTATVLFVLAAILQYDGFHDGEVTTAGFVFTLLGYIVLAVGGWLGGTIVFRARRPRTCAAGHADGRRGQCRAGRRTAALRSHCLNRAGHLPRGRVFRTSAAVAQPRTGGGDRKLHVEQPAGRVGVGRGHDRDTCLEARAERARRRGRGGLGGR